MIIFLLFMEIASGQCPDRTLFREKIKSIYHPESSSSEFQIQKFGEIESQMKKCGMDRDSVFMYLMQKTGILYFDLKKPDSGIYYTKIAIDIAKGSSKNHKNDGPALVDCYYSLFYYYNKLGDDYKKYAAVDSCIKYFMLGSGNFQKVLAALTEKVEYLYNHGDYSLCNQNSLLAEEIISKYYHNKDSIDYVIYFVNLRANSLMYANEISASIKILREKIEQFNRKGFQNSLGGVYNLLGIINRNDGNTQEALACFKKAFKIFSVLRYNNGCASNLSQIGALLSTQLSRPEEGLRYFTLALRYSDIDWDVLVTIYMDKGNVFAHLKKFDSAQHYFQLAFNSLKTGSDEATLLQNSLTFRGFDELNNLFVLCKSKGDAYLKEYYFTKEKSNLKTAIEIYKKTNLLLGKIRIEQKMQPASNLIWKNLAKSMYENAIDACYAGNNIEDAFYFFEESRATLLNDQIDQLRWKADSDITEESNLANEILKLKQKLKDEPDLSEERISIQKNLYTLERRYDEFVNKIRNKNRLYYQMNLDTTALSLSEIVSRLLEKDKSLLEIFSGDSSVYIITASRINQRFYKINKQDYTKLVTQFNSYLSDYSKLNKHFNEFRQVAHNLFKLIIPENKLQEGRIIISPDGENFPFEALVINSSGNPDYFLYRYTISYTYSARYLLNDFNASPNKRINLLGMAPVNFPEETNLAYLSGSDVSLKEIKKYFPVSDNYILKNATKKIFLDSFYRYQIVQLYTHASDSSIQGDPVIYLSDSALYLSRLLPGNKPTTRLVVLSACLTAGGKFYNGEGVFSFNRGFASLGIPATISNLWSVENESTYRITELFYQYLSKGFATDEALQKAKIDFIKRSSEKNRQLPYFWASIILTGKAEIIINRSPSVTFETAVRIMVLILISVVLSKYIMDKRKRRNNIQSE